MSVKVGTAPDSWGVWFAEDPRQTPWRRYLDEVAAAGYAWTELGPYGYLPTEEAVLRRELEARGLQLTAGAIAGDLADPAAWPELERQLDGSGKLLAAFGAPFLVLIHAGYTDLQSGEQIAPRELGAAAWRRLVDTTQRVAEVARERYGLELAFHPHADTQVETEEQIERFLRDTDPELVSLCFDLGHHAYAGGEPVAFLAKHHRRIPYLHLKDVDPGVLARVRAQGISFARAVAMDVMCEPSRGTVDFSALREVLDEIGYRGFAVVEQDMYPAPPEKPLPIARRTRTYLREIGLG